MREVASSRSPLRGLVRVLAGGAGAALVLSVSLTGPAGASAPAKFRPPKVTLPSSITIPAHACYDVSDIVAIHQTAKSRFTAMHTDVRKRGYTLPVGTNRICGFMGSGVYTLSMRFMWETATRVTERVPNMVSNPVISWDENDAAQVTLPFSCQLHGTMGVNTGIYDCALDAPYTGPTVVGLLDPPAKFSLAGMDGSSTLSYMYEDEEAPGASHTPFLTAAQPGGLPPATAFTGTVTLPWGVVAQDLHLDIPEKVQAGTRPHTTVSWDRARDVYLDRVITVVARWSTAASSAF